MIVFRMMLGTPEPMKNVLRSMHLRGLYVISHKACAGWHCASTATSMANVKTTTSPNVTYKANLKCRSLNILE